MNYEYEIAKLKDEVKAFNTSHKDVEIERLKKSILEIKRVAGRNDISDRACC